jgi:hypothetical protein
MKHVGFYEIGHVLECGHGIQMALLTREVHGGRRGVVVFAQRNLEEFGRVSSSQSRA